LSELNTNTFHY